MDEKTSKRVINMAKIKGWKKVKGGHPLMDVWMSKTRKNFSVDVSRAFYSKGWVASIWVKDYYFKNRKDARKFIVRWMRKHPNG